VNTSSIVSPEILGKVGIVSMVKDRVRLRGVLGILDILEVIPPVLMECFCNMFVALKPR
jgi:hypothetical protein